MTLKIRMWLMQGVCLALFSIAQLRAEGAQFVATPYQPQKVLFEFYFDDPHKMASALYWIRSLIVTLEAAPYNLPAEALEIKVVIHGTELVTLAKKNYNKYAESVERMRYYAELGVSFRVCSQAMQDYGYTAAELQDFVTVVPSAIPELVHWQAQGYQLIQPHILEKRFSREEIR